MLVALKRPLVFLSCRMPVTYQEIFSPGATGNFELIVLDFFGDVNVGRRRSNRRKLLTKITVQSFKPLKIALTYQSTLETSCDLPELKETNTEYGVIGLAA